MLEIVLQRNYMGNIICASSSLLSTIAIIIAIVDVSVGLAIAIYFERRHYLKEKSLNISDFVSLKKLETFLKYEIMGYPKKQVNFLLMLVGIDGFDQVNDFLSPPAIEEYLLQIKKAVRIALPPGGKFATFRGNDTFLIYLPSLDIDADTAAQLALNFKNALERKIKLKGEVYIQRSASVALAQFPENGDSRALLLKNLLTSFYKVKKQGGDKIGYCDTNENPYRNYLKNYEIIADEIISRKIKIDFAPFFLAQENKYAGADAYIVRTVAENELGIGQFRSKLQESDDELWVTLWALERAAIYIKSASYSKEISEFYISVSLSSMLMDKDEAPRLFDSALNKYNISASNIILMVDQKELSLGAIQIKQVLAFKDVGFKIGMEVPLDSNQVIEAAKAYKIDFIKFSIANATSERLKSAEWIAQNKSSKLIIKGISNEQELALAQEHTPAFVQGAFLNKSKEGRTIKTQREIAQKPKRRAIKTIRN